MTPHEYREAIERLGLSQIAAARLLGVDARTSRRWASGERDVPPPAVRFLRYLIATKKSGEQAMRVLGLKQGQV
jgi:DNA-binding transcriptional regulator YiaG